jgi:DNA-binding MarR family transcriptional regulator
MIAVKIPDRKDYLLFGGVFVLANKLQVVSDKMVEGLSCKQWFLIRTILDMPSEPPPTIMQIVREMDSTRQNVTKMLEKLERDGLVKWEENTSDRRSHRVRITELGRSSAKTVTENAQAFLKRLFEGIEQTELDAAGGVVLKMMNNLVAMQEEPEQTAHSKQEE